jgi:sec-independent protein translocase protein TatA
MPFGLGIWEIVILAGVLVLLFGAKGAPAMARRLGTGVREMKDAVSEMDPRSVFDAKAEPAAAKPRELEAAKPEAPAKPEVRAAVVAPEVAEAPEADVAPDADVAPEVPKADPPAS